MRIQEEHDPPLPLHELCGTSQTGILHDFSFRLSTKTSCSNILIMCITETVVVNENIEW